MACSEELMTEEKQMNAVNKLNPVGSVPTVFYIPEYITLDQEEQLLNNVYKAPVSKWKSLKNRRLQNWGGVVHEKGLIAQDLPLWLTKITQRICDESGVFPSSINHVLINEYLPDQGIMSHQDGPAYEPVVAILSLGSPVVMNFVPHPSFVNRDLNTSENHNGDAVGKPPNSGVNKQLNEYLPFSIALMPRSLLIFKDKAYADFLHGIKDCEKHQYNKTVNFDESLEHELEQSVSGPGIANGDCEAQSSAVIHRTTTRVSLTCRVVKKVRKNLIKL